MFILNFYLLGGFGYLHTFKFQKAVKGKCEVKSFLCIFDSIYSNLFKIQNEKQNQKTSQHTIHLISDLLIESN